MRGLGLKLAFIMGGSVSCCIKYQMISRIKRAFMKHFFLPWKLSAEVCVVIGVCVSFGLHCPLENCSYGSV